MALIIEDGTGKAGAQAYCDYATYHAIVTELGFTHSHSVEQTEAALVVAAKRWIDGEHDFAGLKLTDDQALAFPRSIVALPKDIIRANALAAWYHLQGELFISNERAIIRQKDKIGELETETQYVVTGQKTLPQDLIRLVSRYTAAGLTTRVLRLQ